MRKGRRRRVLRVLAAILGAMFVLLAAEEIAYRFQNLPAYCTGSNAIWLRHSWIDGAHTPPQYRKLVARLHGMRIRDVYFHAGPLNARGSVTSAKFYDSARFICRVKKLAPDIRLQPWLGQVAEFGEAGRWTCGLEECGRRS